MTNSRCPDHGEHAADLSPSSHLLDQLQLYGHHPFDDEPDPRPLPDPKRLQSALADMFDALVATLSETRLEPDLPDLLWSVANLIHRRIDRIGRARLTQTKPSSPAASASTTARKSARSNPNGSSSRAHADRTAQQLRIQARPGHPAL